MPNACASFARSRFTASGEFHPALKQRLHRSIAGARMATRLCSVWAAGVSERCITQGKRRYFWIRWVRFCGNGGGGIEDARREDLAFMGSLLLRKGRTWNKLPDFSSSLALFQVEAAFLRENTRKQCSEKVVYFRKTNTGTEIRKFVLCGGTFRISDALLPRDCHAMRAHCPKPIGKKRGIGPLLLCQETGRVRRTD